MKADLYLPGSQSATFSSTVREKPQQVFKPRELFRFSFPYFPEHGLVLGFAHGEIPVPHIADTSYRDKTIADKAWDFAGLQVCGGREISPCFYLPEDTLQLSRSEGPGWLLTAAPRYPVN